MPGSGGVAEGKMIRLGGDNMHPTDTQPYVRGIRPRWHVALAVVVASGVSAAAPAQQIYGWTDSKGEVTYSNLPPPKGATVTDVIPDKPLSPAALQEAARRSEISTLNDRIRLLELEQARSKREVVDYPGAPAVPLVPSANACGPEGYGDCNGQLGPYYTTGLLYGNGGRRHHEDHDGHDGHDAGNAKGHGDHPPHKPPAPPSQRLTPIAASPNKSSLPDR
jgi:hypothetical protein